MADSKPLSDLAERGWTRFPRDPDLLAWVDSVRPHALGLMEDPALRDAWLRCGGTWFAGVRALPNDAAGGLPDHGVPPLAGRAVGFLRAHCGSFDLDPAQVSACFAGYPQPMEDESEAAYRYRVRRHAAHVDGLARAPEGRRQLSEFHAFVLGIPLADSHPDASPLSVWEGSHHLVRQALADALDGVPDSQWRGRDVTDAYHAVRRRCFDECRRVSLAAGAGEAYVVHRLALHGIAPWQAPDDSPPRIVVYFRPELGDSGSPRWWLEAP